MHLTCIYLIVECQWVLQSVNEGEETIGMDHTHYLAVKFDDF